MKRCSICHTLVAETEESVDCASCTQPYHRSCWTELGGCATYGCPEAPKHEKPAPPVAAGMGWGDEKSCPKCNRRIASGDLICRCGAKFPYADPMTAAEFRAWEEKRNESSTRRRIIVALFVISLAGIPAPLSGATAAWMAHRFRKDLGGAEGTYQAMCYGAAALGATYALVFLLLAMGA